MTGFYMKHNTGLKWVKQYLSIIGPAVKTLSRCWAKISKLDI